MVGRGPQRGAELAALGDGVIPVPVDLSTPEGPARLVDAAGDAFGGVGHPGQQRRRGHARGPAGSSAVTDEDWEHDASP